MTEPIDDSPHGRFMYHVMADVAQYHSDNLAVEVLKGLETKAKSGGTPYKAPLGYLNLKEVVGQKLIRSVVLDPDAAPLVRWALREFALGDWSLREMCDELERKGLRSRATQKRPAKPLTISGLHHLLRNPYYAGFVVYKGAYYQGNHEPLVDIDSWLHIQDILTAHNKAGEKDRKYPHYLKGTIYCSNCRGRLIYSRNRGRGGLYEYFFCLTHATKRAPCDRGYIKLEAIEFGIEDFYRTFELQPHHVVELRDTIRAELHAARERAAQDAERARRAVAKVKDQQAKLLEAHYEGAVPLDLMKREMDRFTRERANAEAELRLADATMVEQDVQPERVLKVAGNCYHHYLKAKPHLRRQINQGLFEKLLIGPDGSVERAELSEPFSMLLGADAGQPDEIPARHVADRPTASGRRLGGKSGGPRRPSRTGRAAATVPTERNLPRTFRSGQGSKYEHLVPPAVLWFNT
ncbi:recombinase family protein [Kribbella swartbergensis]